MDQDTNSQPQTSSGSASVSNSTKESVKSKLFGDKDGKLSNGLTYEEVMEKDVLDLMGFTTLSEEQKKEMYQKINEMVDNRVAVQILERLSEADKDTYDKLLAENDDKKAYDFLKEREIDINEILFTETIVLKLELIEDSKVVRERTQKMIDEEEKKRKAQNG